MRYGITGDKCWYYQLNELPTRQNVSINRWDLIPKFQFSLRDARICLKIINNYYNIGDMQ